MNNNYTAMGTNSTGTYNLPKESRRHGPLISNTIQSFQWLKWRCSATVRDSGTPVMQRVQNRAFENQSELRLYISFPRVPRPQRLFP